ncbi:SGNH/GDSL hydrolase family protein [Pseudonocardiaceae bacterium YIM PH 21723]|nr:SGNH/GDSL hydrolase family protein [Pseudonocardiaceae bacterium YIM PH 21723]
MMLFAGALGGIVAGAYGVITHQSNLAREIIGLPESDPPRADGVYLPDGSGPVSRGERPLRFAMLGDSMAAGLGVDTPDQLPAVMSAKGLSEESGRPVRCNTYAVVGATTADLAAQVTAAISDGTDVALVIIGGNDVTSRMTIGSSVNLLTAQIRRLRRAGIGVVVGTCPDMAAIKPIPQPLRTVASTWSLALAKAQRTAAQQAGAHTVLLSEVISPEFVQRADELFSGDHFHPNAIGYEGACAVMLPALCAAAGIWRSASRSGMLYS